MSTENFCNDGELLLLRPSASDGLYVSVGALEAETTPSVKGSDVRAQDDGERVQDRGLASGVAANQHRDVPFELQVHRWEPPEVP